MLMPVIVLSQFLFSDTLFILAAVPGLFLSALSGLTQEAFWLSLHVTQYPTITRHDAFISLFLFKVLVFCSWIFLSPASEALCIFCTPRGVLPWLSLFCYMLPFEPCGISLRMRPTFTIRLLSFWFFTCRFFFFFSVSAVYFLTQLALK